MVLSFLVNPVRKDGALTPPFLDGVAASPEGLLARREALFVSSLPKLARLSNGVKALDV